MRLIGTDGDTWRMEDNKNVKFDGDGCQLGSMDEVRTL